MRTRMISTESISGQAITFSTRTPFVLFESTGYDGNKHNTLRVLDADFYVSDEQWAHLESQVTGESEQ
jgi:hypothetical protein